MARKLKPRPRSGVKPAAVCGQYRFRNQKLWKLMNISNDRFIRTTDDYHVESIQKIFKLLYDKGDIYKSVYKGKYCTPCEAFWTDSQLVDGKCPDCGRDVYYAEEEAYSALRLCGPHNGAVPSRPDFLSRKPHERDDKQPEAGLRISAYQNQLQMGIPSALTPSMWSMSGLTRCRTTSPPWVI